MAAAAAAAAVQRLRACWQHLLSAVAVARTHKMRANARVRTHTLAAARSWHTNTLIISYLSGVDGGGGRLRPYGAVVCELQPAQRTCATTMRTHARAPVTGAWRCLLCVCVAQQWTRADRHRSRTLRSEPSVAGSGYWALDSAVSLRSRPTRLARPGEQRYERAGTLACVRMMPGKNGLKVFNFGVRDGASLSTSPL